MELLVEGEIAGQEAAVESGESEFEVAGIESPGFLECAVTGAGAQANLPHSLNEDAYDLFAVRLGFIIGKDEQHVDVGVGKKVLAAIAAQGEQSGADRRLAGEGTAPHLNQHTVHHGGTSPDGGGAVSGALAGQADERHLPRILLPKIVNRQSDWIHKWLCVAYLHVKGLLTA